MGDKVGNSTKAPASAPTTVQQTDNVNPFVTAPVAGRTKEDIESAKSKHASRQHASEKKEYNKLEGSLRQSELHQNYFKDSDKDINADRNDRSKMYHPAAIPPGYEKKLPSVNETREEGIVEAGGGKGRLVPLKEGKPDRPMTVTVHGWDGNPDTVKSLSKRAAKAGDAVSTFAYNDTGRRLADSSKDLQKGLEKWMKENPGRTLRIDAHSMGGRVAMHALDQLEKKGLLKDRKVELNLIACPLSGTWTGRLAVFDSWNSPGRDMSPSSKFQDRLDDIKFNKNVKVRVFTAGDDNVVSQDEDFNKIAKNLRAQIVPLPNADHDTAVDQAARWLDRNERKRSK